MNNWSHDDNNPVMWVLGVLAFPFLLLSSIWLWWKFFTVFIPAWWEVTIKFCKLVWGDL